MSMNEGMVWIEAGYFKGWHCSECSWAFAAIRVDTTVAVLVLNRGAQDGFEKHHWSQPQRNRRLALKQPASISPFGKPATHPTELFPQLTADAVIAQLGSTPSTEAASRLLIILF